MADHRAMARVRTLPRPQRRDQREGCRVGHAGGQATEDPGPDQHAGRRRVGGKQACGNREQHAEDQHHLAPVAVAQRTQPQHRSRQAEGVPDRDQVELCLGCVEVTPYLG